MTPQEILDGVILQVTEHPEATLIHQEDILRNASLVCRNLQNRAVVRLVLACLLAKVHRPEVDVRKPYTKIKTADSFSGRTYDEAYITEFVIKHNLPCNLTTAFLTPALRNIDHMLTPDIDLVGRPREVYKAALQLLDDVHKGRVTAHILLSEIIRLLVVVRDEKAARMASLISALHNSPDDVPLSAETILNLIHQHLSLKGASRLPVMVVAAAYQSASHLLQEEPRPLEAHNAADKQTQAIGDLQIAWINGGATVTVYEMKMKAVTINDLDHAVIKIRQSVQPISAYVFITTETTSEEVDSYAASLYDQLGGVEVAILDCLGFLRHFLYLFHRLRMQFLDAYQALLLAEPNSAVSQPLKEAFLALRQAVESSE
jgi:DNA adenine methylase